ncbi:MAG: DUF4433 domain-containing protein [Candidatus Gastranaerophilales bacterium]|nr:DUF4433 domain-containing protein [Candidatus Gastranaerophilales bacterium]
MLFILHCSNHEDLVYRGGQQPIIHLETDLYKVIDFLNKFSKRWVFTLSNAGAYYFEDRCNIEQLNEINWQAVYAENWSDSTIKEGKQAEFLVEEKFPWELFDKIGVYNLEIYQKVAKILDSSIHRPQLQIIQEWYY